MAAGLAAFLAVTQPAQAHPHVWVTVKSQIAFSPEGKVISVTHDWVFDEMYSSFATQGLAKPGALATRQIFAPVAQENAANLAQLGYFTTLKIGGKAVDFAPVTQYWMEERPDHLIVFHVVLTLKTPAPPGRYFSLLVADPEYFIDFEFDDKDPVTLAAAPQGCQVTISRPKPLVGEAKEKLSESFFTGLAPGTNFGFKMASRAMVTCP